MTLGPELGVTNARHCRGAWVALLEGWEYCAVYRVYDRGQSEGATGVPISVSKRRLADLMPQHVP